MKENERLLSSHNYTKSEDTAKKNFSRTQPGRRSNPTISPHSQQFCKPIFFSIQTINQSIFFLVVKSRSQSLSLVCRPPPVKSPKISKKEAVTKMLVLQQEKDQLQQKLLQVERERNRLKRQVAELKEENNHFRKLYDSGSLCLSSRPDQKQKQEIGSL